MRSFGTLLLAFFISLIFGGALQTQIAVKIGAQEEHILAMVIFMLMTVATTLALGAALLLASRISGVDRIALALLVVTVLGLVALVAVGAAADRKLVIRPADLALLGDIAIPTVLMILIQWWLVRRRWFNAHRRG